MPPRGRKTRKEPTLSAFDLREALTSGPAKPAYLLLGPEAFSRGEALSALQQVLLGENPGPSHQEFDGKKTDLAPVLDELRTMPFLGTSHRLVVVTDAGVHNGFLSKHGEDLTKFLAAGSPDTATLVLCVDKVDRRLKTTKALLKVTAVVDCSPPSDDAALLAFVRARAKARGASFARRADRALLDRLGGQDVPLSALDSEVGKLADAAAGKPIDADLVEALSSVGSSEQAFGLIDQMARGDVNGALCVLQRIFRDGLITAGGSRTREATGIAMILLPTLRWDLGRLLKARAALDRGMPPRAVAKEVRVFRGQDAFLRRVRRAEPEELRRRHALMRQGDVDLRTSADPWATMVRVITALTLSERGAARAR